MVSPGICSEKVDCPHRGFKHQTGGYARPPAPSGRRAEDRRADAHSAREPATSACGTPSTRRRPPSPVPGTWPGPRSTRRCRWWRRRTAAKAHQCPVMYTTVILAARFPSATYDTPASASHVILARAELRDRPHPTRCYRRNRGNSCRSSVRREPRSRARTHASRVRYPQLPACRRRS